MACMFMVKVLLPSFVLAVMQRACGYPGSQGVAAVNDQHLPNYVQVETHHDQRG